VVRQSEETDAWVFEDGERVSAMVALQSTPGISPVNWRLQGMTYDQVRPGAYDAKARLEDMTTDMIYAQVLHPSIAVAGASTFSGTDRELQLACVVAYNEWLAEYCSADPGRLVGMAMMPTTGVDDALAELKRTYDVPGLHGALLGAYPNGSLIPLPDDDRFWAAAQEMNEPVVIHLSLVSGEDGEGSGNFYELSKPLILARINLERSARGIMQALGEIILSGIPERFPSLRIIGTETGIGWIPYFMEQLDDNFLRHRFWADTDLTMLPSEYFRRQCFSTFQVDSYGVRNRDHMLYNIMWSTDYPHSGADWPNSVVTLERNLVGVPDNERELILRENCIRAFNLAASKV
jgi:predicted TIM-barrel fold metal-dependent hydrolase